MKKVKKNRVFIDFQIETKFNNPLMIFKNPYRVYSLFCNFSFAFYDLVIFAC